MANLNGVPFPEWYRKNRELIVSVANLLWFWKKGKAILLSLVAAFDAVLVQHPFNGSGLRDDNVRLGDVIVNEKG